MEKKTIHARLAEIQQQLNVPKNQLNKFGGYKYRSTEDIVEALKPLLGELTLQISDEIVLVGNRYYVKATAKLTDGKELVETSAYAREAENKKGMDEAQVTGSSSSYARKYALNGLFAIDDTKDADTQEPPRTVAQKPVGNTEAAFAKKRAEFFAVASEKGLEAERAKAYVKDFYKVGSFNNLTLEQLTKTTAGLRNIGEEKVWEINSDPRFEK